MFELAVALQWSVDGAGEQAACEPAHQAEDDDSE